MAKDKKTNIEFSFVNINLERRILKRLTKSRNIGQLDLIWPRTGVAKKSAAREMVFNRGICDFSSEEWTKRIAFREEIEDHCGLAFAVTESVTAQKARRFLRLTAKYALKMGADFMEKAMVGYADIASSPMDALAMMLGEKDVPQVIARGVLDVKDLPKTGEEKTLEINLVPPGSTEVVGKLTLLLKA